MRTEPTLRTCPKGHRYYKSSDCPTCPKCEELRVPETEFMNRIYRPARRALESAGIHTLQDLARHTEAEVLALHGMGPTTMPILRAALEEAGLAFREEDDD